MEVGDLNRVTFGVPMISAVPALVRFTLQVETFAEQVSSGLINLRTGNSFAETLLYAVAPRFRFPRRINSVRGGGIEYGVVSTESLELTQAMAIDSPPVFTSPHIITLQPQGELEDQPNPRVIPARVQDWISTPRSQMSALSGNHFLGNVEQLEIQQIVDLSTLLGRVERGLQYRVKVPNAETLFLAMELRPASESVGFSCSKFIRDDHTLNVMDQWGEPAFVMKINSRWSYTLTKLRKITVGSLNLIGTVEENFSIMGPSFTIYDSMRNRLCNINGPNVCDCCMYKEAQFQVLSVDGTHQIATLMHQWNNTLHDYSFLITFPPETDMKLKSLLLAATFLLEYTYFG